MIGMEYGSPNWRGISLTFYAYVTVHAARKAFTNTKYIAIADLGVSPGLAGSLDAAFMLSYAIGLLLLGGLSDSSNSRSIKLLLGSLIGMGCLQIVFSELCIQGAASLLSGRMVMFGVWISNGFAQSLAWPCCVALVQSFLNHSPKSTTIFSFWACNGIVGNVVSSAIAAIVVGEIDAGTSGFRWIFVLTSLLAWAAALAVKHVGASHGTRSPPVEIPLDDISDTTGEACDDGANGPAAQAHLLLTGEDVSAPPTIWATLGLRGVVDFSICHLCIKAVAYGMFFWLPFYLVKAHGVTPATAAGVSILYDLATLVGGPTCGYLVDRSGKPAMVIAIFSILAALPQFLVGGESLIKLPGESPSIPPSVTVCILISGFLVGGILNVLSAAVCANLGGHGATGTVTGIIDGVGSLGAAATQVLIPLIGVDDVKGWARVFGLLGLLMVVSAVTLFRIVWDELREPRSETYR